MTKPPNDALFEALARAVQRHGRRCTWIEICLALGWSLDCALRANPDAASRAAMLAAITANLNAAPQETMH